MSRRLSRILTDEEAFGLRFRRACGASIAGLARVYRISKYHVRRVLCGLANPRAPWPVRDADGWWTRPDGR